MWCSCALWCAGLLWTVGCATIPKATILDLPKDPESYQIVERVGPGYLDFDELKALVENPRPTGELGQKLKDPVILRKWAYVAELVICCT